MMLGVTPGFPWVPIFRRNAPPVPPEWTPLTGVPGIHYLITRGRVKLRCTNCLTMWVEPWSGVSRGRPFDWTHNCGGRMVTTYAVIDWN